jgi:predicted TIM-barrel fold metal-dependent hydrolase
MRIVDAHAHVFERLSGFGSRGELRPIGQGRGRWATGEEIQVVPEKYGNFDFCPEQLIGLMDRNGVDRALLLQGCLYGFQNEFIFEVVNRFPDRFVGSGTLDPLCKGAERILDHLINDFRFRILKFELSSGGGLMGYHETLKIDGPEMEIVWHKAADQNIVIVLDIGNYGMASFQVDAIVRVVKRYPNLKMVLAHLLAPSPGLEKPWKEAVLKLRNTEILFDITALPWNIREPYPYPTAAGFLSNAKKLLGSERLIWGSDAPILLTIATYERLKDFVMNSGVFTDSELHRVMGGNAAEIYDI